MVAGVAIACLAIQLASPTLLVHASAHWGLAQPTPQGSLGSTLHMVPALQVVVVVGGELYGKDWRDRGIAELRTLEGTDYENALLQMFVHNAAPASMWGVASLSVQTCMLAMITASSMLLYSTHSH